MTGIPDEAPARLPTVAEGLFAVIACRVHRDGEPYPEGTRLRETASKSAVVCEECGPLPGPALYGWTSDWLALTREALVHAAETGHRVAVESWNGALYAGEDGNLVAGERED